MPVAAENRARYPKDWALRSYFVRFVRGRGLCEWCGARHGALHPITGSRVVLTCAHIFDDRPEEASLLNLAGLCQRCHNRHDAKARRARRAERIQLTPSLFPPAGNPASGLTNTYANRTH